MSTQVDVCVYTMLSYIGNATPMIVYAVRKHITQVYRVCDSYYVHNMCVFVHVCVYMCEYGYVYVHHYTQVQTYVIHVIM